MISSRRSCPTSTSARRKARRCWPAGEPNKLPGDLAGGYYIKPTIFEGHNKMRVFQEEIFGPVVSVTILRYAGGGVGDRKRHSLRARRRRLDARSESAPTGSAAASRRGGSGRTAITLTLRMRHSVATRSRVSAAKRTR